MRHQPDPPDTSQGWTLSQVGVTRNSQVLLSAPLPSSLLRQGEEIFLRRCRVLFSYQPVHDDELELQVDQTFEFMGEVEDRWWCGRIGDRVGVFPYNLVEMVSEAPKEVTKALRQFQDREALRQF